MNSIAISCTTFSGHVLLVSCLLKNGFYFLIIKRLCIRMYKNMSALIEFVGQRFARFVVFVILFYHIKLSYGRSARNHYKTVLKCLLTKTKEII